MKGWREMVESKAEWYNFAIHVARGRWTSMFAAFLIMATSGGALLFPYFSVQINRNLGYTNSMLSTLNKWNDIGASAGILAGPVAEVTPTWFVLGIGSLTNFFGYFMIWLAVSGKVSKPEVWLMSLYMFIGAGSHNFSTTASVVTSVKNFPERRSMILGLLTGYAGLSTPIFAQISVALYGDNLTSLILLVAWLPALISLLFMHTVGEKRVTIRQPHEPKVFYHFLFLSAIPAIYLMTIALVKQYVTFSQAANVGSAIPLCVFLFLPAVVAYRQEVLLWKQVNAPSNAIIIDSPQAVEEEENSSANQVGEAEEDIIIVEQEQNTSEIIVEQEQNSSEIVVEQEQNTSEILVEQEQNTSEIIVEQEQNSSEIVVEQEQNTSEILVEQEQNFSEIIVEQEQNTSEIIVEQEQNSSEIVVEQEQNTSEILVEQEQNFSEIIVEQEQNTSEIIVEQEQNSSAEAHRSFFMAIFKKPKRGEDYGILQAIVSIDMLIIFLAAGVGLGSLLTTLVKMSRISESLQYDHNMVILFIPLVNFWNYAGRVSCGFISEKLVVKFKAPRPLMLAAVLFLSCIGLLLIAFPFKNSLYLALVIIAFTLGALLPLVLAIISDIFGLKHYATLFNCGQVTSPTGLYLLNQQLTERLYHIEAAKLHGMEGMVKPHDCKGKHCFDLAFKIMAIATLFGGIISLILAVRTRLFYKNDIYRRYRGGLEEAEVALRSTDQVDEASSSVDVVVVG